MNKRTIQKTDRQMKKEYAVSVDITMSKTIYVDAEDEEEARRIAHSKVNTDPYYLVSQADAYVDHCVVDVNETED